MLQNVRLLFGRRTELALLLFPPALLALGLYALRLNDHPPSPLDLRWPVVFAAAFLGAHFFLALLRPHADQVLLPVVAMIAAIGLLFVARLEPDLAPVQLTWMSLGLLLMVGVMIIVPNLVILRNYKYLAATGGITLLAATALFGREVNGARLWLGVGPFAFQATEVIKVLLVIFLAGYLSEKREILSRVTMRWAGLRLPALPYLVPLALIWALTLAMLVWQKDLGAVAILMGVTVVLLYVATGRLSFVLGGILLLVINVFLTYQVFGYVRSRIDVWLDPWAEASAAGYQIVQSLYAFAAGGLFGAGPGRGLPDYIPAVHTDFVFAAVGEELGLMGTAGLLALYLVLTSRGLKTAAAQAGDFALLLAIGASVTLALQTLVIMAGNVGLIPVTGVTLPFVSYGGSSVVVNFVLIGFLLQLSATSPQTGS